MQEFINTPNEVSHDEPEFECALIMGASMCETVTPVVSVSRVTLKIPIIPKVLVQRPHREPEVFISRIFATARSETGPPVAATYQNVSSELPLRVKVGNRAAFTRFCIL